MAEFVLSCESAIDLSKKMAEEENLSCMHYRFRMDEREYNDDFFESISDTEFYQRMLQGEATKTSAFNMDDYETYFEPFLEEGKDILHVTLSSGLTSTVQNARLAAEELMSKYPERKINIVDSISACGGYGLLMTELSERKKNGMELTELTETAEKLKFNVCHLFFSTDLTFYIRGGRIPKTAGVFAAALNICPFCDIDDMGFLVVREKVRTKRKVRERMVERVSELAQNGTDYDGRFYINHSYCEEDAVLVRDAIEEKFPNLKEKTVMNPIGPTIGSHTGPATVAVFFIGKAREESERSREAKA